MSYEIIYHPIGIIRTQYLQSEGMPIQPTFSKSKGTVIISSDFQEALQGLDEFSHIILIYHFHQAKKPKYKVKPFLSSQELGLFAIRAPNRPNPIGISIVRLEKIITKEDSIEIIFSGADMLDQTPLLDIKPYIAEFDAYPNSRNGWYDSRDIPETTADKRFSTQ